MSQTIEKKFFGNSPNYIEKSAYMWAEEKKKYIKLSSYAEYVSVIKKYIVPFFGEKDIKNDESLKCEISNFTGFLMSGLSPKTVKDILTVTNQIFIYARENGYAEKSDVTAKMPKCEFSPIEVLSPSDCKKLTEYLQKSTDTSKIGILLCLFTGIRLGEICGLRRGDIDLENGVIKIRRTIQRIYLGGVSQFHIGSPKTKNSIRDIPLPAFLCDKLKNNACTDPLCYYLSGSPSFVQPRTYQNRFKKYLAESGVTGNFHFHTLRHTFASRAVELGFDPKTLSEILGHASVNITLNRYVHTSLASKRRSMDLFSSII